MKSAILYVLVGFLSAAGIVIVFVSGVMVGYEAHKVAMKKQQEEDDKTQ